MDHRHTERASVLESDQSLLTAPDVIKNDDSPARIAAHDSKSSNSAEAYLPPMTVEDFRDRALALADRADPNHLDHITGGDLARLAENPDIKGRDADVLAAMYQTTSRSVQLLELGPYTMGAPMLTSRAAIEKLVPSSETEMTYILAEADQDPKNFAAADKNHDGRLNQSEVNAAPDYRDLVSRSPWLQSELGGKSGAIELLDFQVIYGDSRDEINTGFAFVELAHAAEVRRNMTTTHELYSDKTNPLNSISMQDVHQGTSGDCYFEAVLASLAQQRPELIRDAIKDNGDGSFTVTFPGDASNPVTIKAPTDTELGLYNGGSDSGIWAPVMEKAYAQYMVQSGNRFDADFTNQDAISGGNPYLVIPLLTGNGGANFEFGTLGEPGQLDAASAGQLISKTLQDKLLISVAFKDDKEAEAAGFYSAHSYTVVGFEPGANGGTVTVRNPWGESVGTDGKYHPMPDQKLSLDYLAAIGMDIDVEYKY